MTLADYLIGATPDEVDMLKHVRELTAENQRLVERWIQVTLRTQEESGPGKVTPDDLRVVDAPPAALTRRTRRGRPA